MSIDNLAVRWTKEETELLEKYIESQDLEALCDLLPGRSKASIRAKQKRLLKANPIPSKLIPHIFKYYIEQEEAEGQILKRLVNAGYNFTLRDIGLAIKKAREQSEAIYAEERGHKPTFQQLQEFIRKRNG